jgi:hypothetical protein
MVNRSEMRVKMVRGRGVGDICNMVEWDKADDSSVWLWWWQFQYEYFVYDDVNNGNEMFIMWWWAGC